MAASEPDVVLPSGTHIDTELGLIQDAAGNLISVKSLVVAQDGGPSIRAFIARSFVVDDLLAEGSFPLAFVSSGRISVVGHLDASAHGPLGGPGAEELVANACVGRFTQIQGDPSTTVTPGAGGGGHATAGGAGGNNFQAGPSGGTVRMGVAPLRGGCRGGRVLDMQGTATTYEGGGGGGGLHLVSLQEIALTNDGTIDVGGGGAGVNAGGGSGGLLFFEAPHVRFSGSTTGIAANGGAGGSACDGIGGDDGDVTTTSAGSQCDPTSIYGRGGTRTTPATAGILCTTSCFNSGLKGGGGGAAGRARISTRDGNYEVTGTPVVSADISTSSLTTR